MTSLPRTIPTIHKRTYHWGRTYAMSLGQQECRTSTANGTKRKFPPEGNTGSKACGANLTSLTGTKVFVLLRDEAGQGYWLARDLNCVAVVADGHVARLYAGRNVGINDGHWSGHPWSFPVY